MTEHKSKFQAFCQTSSPKRKCVLIITINVTYYSSSTLVSPHKGKGKSLTKQPEFIESLLCFRCCALHNCEVDIILHFINDETGGLERSNHLLKGFRQPKARIGTQCSHEAVGMEELRCEEGGTQLVVWQGKQLEPGVKGLRCLNMEFRLYSE